ncbi:hypothetical protein GLAREA_07313 [Glarea lozoyensis ATCC 20868]|uniref:Uncharacterized protein n=1 Tax=Glarea lozoyensis (strain ATCC 20868 / MF5171) TaxID=1116229 RepID=S3D2Z2_GLAL2|nr:uncharacterized protein GLAREA_07313 [Glarea lozoyensis ATCC 20868]EPE32180.1 hypothetical protein GLAREA_07313 [Glarea lozoyensis ATCC 20868]
MQLFKLAALAIFTTTALAMTDAEVASARQAKLDLDAASGLEERTSGFVQEVRIEERKDCDGSGTKKCTCRAGSSGVYCGLCNAVVDKGDSPKWTGYIFQCDGTKCCEYGKATHCAASTYDNWCPR